MSEFDEDLDEDRDEISLWGSCKVCGSGLDPSESDPFVRRNRRREVGDFDEERDRNEFEMPRRPDRLSRSIVPTIMGLWMPSYICTHCKADDYYFRDTDFLPVLEELRSTPRHNPADHAAYLAAEISALEKFLGVTDAASVPDFVRAEMVALMSDPDQRSAVAGFGSNDVGPFGITTPEVIDGYDPHTETATVRMPISRMVRLLGARGPRPLTVVWQRYRELWEERQAELREEQDEAEYVERIRSTAEYTERVRSIAEYMERVRSRVDQTFDRFLDDDAGTEEA